MFTLLLLACTETDGTNPKGTEAAASCDRAESAITLEDAADLGFAPADVLTWLEATHTTSFSLVADDAERDVNVVVTSDGSATFVDLQPAASSGGVEPAMEAMCTDHIELGAAVNFVTNDGLFDEAWTLQLTSEQAAAADGTVDLGLDELGGSYVVPGEMTEGCDTTSLSFSLYFSKEGGPSGELDLVCESVDGDTASVGMDVLAGWGEGEVE